MIVIQIVLLLIIGVVAIFLLNHFVRILLFNQAPFIRTDNKVINSILAEIELKDEMAVYELGCGTAEFLKSARKKNSQIKLVGYESFLFPYLLARFENYFFKSNIIFKRKDFFQADLNEVDVAYCYLNPKTMAKLAEKFKKECRPGTIIFSYQFSILTWTAKKIIKIEHGKKIYKYQI